MTFFDWSFGIVGFSIPWALVYFLITTHITFVSITLYLHRHSAHRSLDLHPVVSHFFRFVLWFSTGMITKEWTAIHRKHHAKTETDEDPHSPVVHGLSNILLQGVEYYRDAIDEETVKRYGKGTPDDWVERNIYSKNVWLGVTILLFINLALFGVLGVVVWALQMIWTPFWGAGVVNGIGHAIGYRNFEVADNSRNICPIGIFLCGEELHNNHHTYPNSARFSVKPWEFDVGWFYIRILSVLKLARPVHTQPVAETVSEKSTIDMDTLWAVINDRFSVMATYAKKVVHPTIKQERKGADLYFRKLLRRGRKAISAHDAVLQERDKNHIKQITKRSPSLKRIYELRLSLNAIWAKRTGNAEELLVQFRTWCREAEETGLEHLRYFVKDLRTYTVPKST